MVSSMNDVPKNNIDRTDASHQASRGLGLNPLTARLEHCQQALGFITDKLLTLSLFEKGIAIAADENSMLSLVYEAAFKSALARGVESDNKNSVANQAHAINRMASKMDAEMPIKTAYTRSRMEILWAIQHNPEIMR